MHRKTQLCALFMPIIVGILILCILFIVMLITINNKAEWQGPNRGLWYCKELQLQLCCQPNILINGNSKKHIDTRSYMLVDESLIMCEICTDKGDDRLMVINQDPLDKTRLGEILFDGKFVSLDAHNYVVKDELGTLFIFEYIDEFSLSELQKECREQINAYNGMKSVVNAQHIETAIQAAKSLWITELGIDTADKTVDIAYDFQFDCWYISVAGTYEVNALISRNGQVIGVWGQ